MIRVAFDIGGVLSKEPDVYRQLARCLLLGGHDVRVITDMHPRELVLETLRINGFDFIPEFYVHIADYTAHGEGCKAVLAKELRVDILIDDFIGYVAPDGAAVRCLVMPDASKPYYHPTWKTVAGEPEFGRRVYSPMRIAGGEPVEERKR